MADKKKMLAIVVLLGAAIVAAVGLYAAKQAADNKARQEVIDKSVAPVELPPEKPNSRPITDSPLPPPPAKP